jgi:hypothetical protein
MRLFLRRALRRRGWRRSRASVAELDPRAAVPAAPGVACPLFWAPQSWFVRGLSLFFVAVLLAVAVAWPLLASTAAPAAHLGLGLPTAPAAATPVTSGVLLVSLLRLGGPGEGRLSAPQDAHFGPGGRIYVADTGGRRVAIFDAAGRLVGAIRRGAHGALQEPFSLAWAKDGTLLVLDSEAGVIDRFTAAGRFLDSSPASLNLTHARGLAVGPHGQVYVAQTAADAVYVLDAGLRLQATLAAVGVAGRRFAQPVGVAVDAGGRIYVVDGMGGRVVVFAPDWRLLGSWPVAVPDTLHAPHVLALAEGAMAISDPAAGAVLLAKALGTSPQRYVLPMGADAGLLGLDTDADGHLLLVCSAWNQVLELRLPAMRCLWCEQ